ncbi:hypothetical protein P344_02580 [Spiroplasma mirum ATCC 29335]|uniref:Dihydrofolate reductase n=1 Tax=Spiroplasma mirum ATCC 29335 TaxID=838561 RepID=W0GQG2_9MOLU|nr:MULTISPECIES: dihydrofolate reductase [Spiroplasma]AHF60869.1 putative dihydrofolate reductase [Spiroplasma mirum ATCC 29335]AHI57862.1 hypothetical protein P344_02580 [Spiroplasma mirum ATCC 29335]AKM52981.1 dihydrofolate reductase [Spiroplasma atrichopogonis]
MIKLLWAMDQHGLIGKDNHLPWHIKAELQHFKAETLNKTILLGRTTFEVINCVLPNRKTIVVTHNPNYHFDHPDVQVVHDLQPILTQYQQNPDNELIVCGGSKVYEETLPVADQLIISYIKGKYTGDTYFPPFNLDDFELKFNQEYDEFTVKKYVRRRRS